MAYTPPPSFGYGNGNGAASKTPSRTKPVLTKTKSVAYNATTSDQIFAISSSVSATTKVPPDWL